MIGEHPLLGVGVGSFHLLTADYGALTGYEGHLVPDNAQNWFRHQLAEFGILGGLGWITWVAMFVVFVLRAPIADADRRFRDGRVARPLRFKFWPDKFCQSAIANWQSYELPSVTKATIVLRLHPT